MTTSAAIDLSVAGFTSLPPPPLTALRDEAEAAIDMSEATDEGDGATELGGCWCCCCSRLFRIEGSEEFTW